MLQTMRDNSKGVVAGILVGLLVIIFALSGAEALFTSQSNNQTVLTVNGEEISQTQLARAIEQQKRQMRQRFGDSIPAEMLSDENLRGPAIDNLTQRTLLAQAAQELGMAVPEQRLNQMITSTSAFQNEQGQFDPQRYQQALRMLAYTPSSYKNEITRDLTINQLANGVSGSSFVTDEEFERLIDLNFQTRSFNYVTLSADKIKEGIDVTDAEVTEYYNANTESFTQPETITVEYIELSVDELMDEVEVNEETLRAQYEQNRENFEPNVERRAAHILLEDADENTLSEIQQKLADGADFAQLAQTYSDDLGSKDQGGELGVTSGDTFPDAFEQALAKLSEGEVSGPVETDAGTHFIKLLEETGAEPASFEEQREQLAQQLKRTRAENRFIEQLEQLEDLSYNARSLETVGEQLDLAVRQSEPFSRSGGSGIAGRSAVVSAAFGEDVLDNGNASEVIELSANHVVVVKKIDHSESYVKPQADVRERIVATLRQQKAEQRLAEKGAALEEALSAGADLKTLAEERDLTFEQAESVERSSSDLPRPVLEQAFSMPVPEQGKSVSGFSANGQYSVIELTQVQAPQESLPQEQRESMAQSMASLYGAADFASLRAYLRETADIEQD